MIGSLNGKAIGFLDDNATVIIDVNGVGYRVTVVTSLFQKLAGSDGNITLFIHTRV
ncbi:MAG: Holliday junction branch migration protein RuvA, partial [Acidimicrobiales bacterium]|nr:Holliday junction branch migration protein RuvA [Acidimicrobiales bacterium]